MLSLDKTIPGFRRSSKPKVALVTPAWLGGYCWNFCEGWQRALKDLAIPHETFHVPREIEAIKALFGKLATLECDLVLLSCGDHHLRYLHDEGWKVAFWRELKTPVICFCNERSINSPFPESEAATRSAIIAFDAFLYVDEFAGPMFRASGKPSLWVSQFADDTLFLSDHPFEKRKNIVYFRAQLSNFGIPGVYSARRALIEAVRDQPGFSIRDGLLGPVEFAKDLSRQRFVLRAPSNCPGWVENFWTALAAGCVVFHQKLPVEEARSRELLVPGRHYLEYDIARPDKLVRQAADVLRNWGDYRVIAENGKALLKERYTIRHFMEAMIEFVDKKCAKKI